MDQQESAERAGGAIEAETAERPPKWAMQPMCTGIWVVEHRGKWKGTIVERGADVVLVLKTGQLGSFSTPEDALIGAKRIHKTGFA